MKPICDSVCTVSLAACRDEVPVHCAQASIFVSYVTVESIYSKMKTTNAPCVSFHNLF